MVELRRKKDELEFEEPKGVTHYKHDVFHHKANLCFEPPIRFLTFIRSDFKRIATVTNRFRLDLRTKAYLLKML